MPRSAPGSSSIRSPASRRYVSAWNAMRRACQALRQPGKLVAMENQAAVVEALGVAIAARVPVLLWGAPGTGKTSVIRSLAEQAGWPCETVIASIREPSDFAGLPIVVDGRVDFAPPRWAVRLADAGHGVAFFD